MMVAPELLPPTAYPVLVSGKYTEVKKLSGLVDKGDHVEPLLAVFRIVPAPTT
jgi:hypothetical protein